MLVMYHECRSLGFKVGDYVEAARKEEKGRVTGWGPNCVDIATVDGRTVSLNPHIWEIKKVPPPPPKWQPGDVVTIRFGGRGVQYTYVRGWHNWPGDSSRLSDEEVDCHWEFGNVRHMMRDGEVIEKVVADYVARDIAGDIDREFEDGEPF